MMYLMVLWVLQNEELMIQQKRRANELVFAAFDVLTIWKGLPAVAQKTGIPKWLALVSG